MAACLADAKVAETAVEMVGREAASMVEKSVALKVVRWDSLGADELVD